MKKLTALIAALAMMAMMAACTSKDEEVGIVDPTTSGTTSEVGGETSEAGETNDGGAATANGGELTLGSNVETMFFDFVVASAARTDEYAGYEATEGNTLLDIVIRCTNTFPEAIPMADYEFQVQWGDPNDEDAYNYCLDALDDTMAPGETTLDEDESMEWHYVFEVPADEAEFFIAYQDYYVTTDGTEGVGDAYFVSFSA